MNGMATPSKASRSAMLVCVNAPGLMIKGHGVLLRAMNLRDQLVLGIALQAPELDGRGPGAFLQLGFDACSVAAP
jgi:hypothetical protein